MKFVSTYKLTITNRCGTSNSIEKHRTMTRINELSDKRQEGQ